MDDMFIQVLMHIYLEIAQPNSSWVGTIFSMGPIYFVHHQVWLIYDDLLLVGAYMMSNLVFTAPGCCCCSSCCCCWLLVVGCWLLVVVVGVVVVVVVD
jgi:streptolysin S family bacteriocin protoxin